VLSEIHLAHYQLLSHNCFTPPAIGDYNSYNNLAAIAASGNDLASTLTYFQPAAEWKPSLEDLDHNWGHAEFLASRFQDAALPLSRALRIHPEDTSLRSMLGIQPVHDGALFRSAQDFAAH
jgi:tetratricopeptide (TPR) repeat protein